MAAPPGWEALRGDAPSLRDDLVALVARTPLWPSLTRRQREGTGFLLGQVARMSASSGAVATLIRVVPAPAGTAPTVGSITLSWLRTAPVRADLDLARLVAGDADAEPFTTGVGPGLVTRRREPVGASAVDVTTQVVAPVPDSVWLAVVTGSAGTPEGAADQAGTNPVDDAVLAVARSLTVQRRPTPAGDHGDRS